jgi:hypothetical protein
MRGPRPFSFSAGERKLMTHFVVQRLFRFWLRLCPSWSIRFSRSRCQALRSELSRDERFQRVIGAVSLGPGFTDP